MKEYYDQIKSMANKSVELLPKKKSYRYVTASIMTAGSLSGLVTTATLYLNAGNLTDKEYDRIVKFINKKIDNL